MSSVENVPLPLCQGALQTPSGQAPRRPCPFTYIVLQVAIAAWLGQQQLDDLHVPVLAGAHERRGALVVLDVDVSPAGQQALHHVDPPVADRQHECCLSRLQGGRAAGASAEQHRPSAGRWRDGVTGAQSRRGSNLALGGPRHRETVSRSERRAKYNHPVVCQRCPVSRRVCVPVARSRQVQRC